MVTLHFGRNCFLNTTWKSHCKITVSLLGNWKGSPGQKVTWSHGCPLLTWKTCKNSDTHVPPFRIFRIQLKSHKKMAWKKVLWPIVARAFLDICSLRGKSEKTGRRGASKVSLIPWNRRERARRISQGAQRVRQQLPAAYSKLDMNLTRFERGKTS